MSLANDRRLESPPAGLSEQKSKGTKHKTPPKIRKRVDFKILGLQLLVLALILGSWQESAALNLVDPLFVSKPSSVAVSLWHGLSNVEFFRLMGTTLYETFVGFGIAAATGVVSGFILYQWPLVDKVFRPFLTAFNNTPRIALAPIFVLWFGLGSESRIVLVISLVFFIITFNTYAGLQNADRDILQLAKALGAKPLVRFRYFTIPGAVPSIFAGLQLGLTYAFLGAVVGEMLTGSGGLGAFLATTSADFKTSEFFAALVWLLVVATAVSALMRLVERQLLKWRRAEMRGLSD